MHARPGRGRRRRRRGPPPCFWVAGSSMAEEPARATVAGAARRPGRRRHTVLDLDYRADRSGPSATRPHGDRRRRRPRHRRRRQPDRVRRRRRHAPIPTTAADAAARRGVELAIVKLGGDGVLVATPRAARPSCRRSPVEVVCGLGAGDAFGGALVHGLLSGWAPAQAVELRQRRRCDRGLAPAVLRRDADDGRGRRAAGGARRDAV